MTDTEYEFVPSSVDGATPSEFATALVEWATGNRARLLGSYLESNGTSQRAFLRRLDECDLGLLGECPQAEHDVRAERRRR